MNRLTVWPARTPDEREQSFTARAQAIAFSVTYVACAIIACVELVNGHPNRALIAAAPGLLGSLTATALMFRWRVFR